MQVYKYNFGGCTVEVISEQTIEKERNYSLFSSDFNNADYSIRVIKTDLLPEKQGDAIFISDRRSIYRGENELQYTAYFNTGVRGYKDYACKVNDELLYIDSAENLRELTVFDALNLPSMLLKRGIGILHCSFVDASGSAVLFAGEKQVGKSTQARLWKECLGCETINGDRAALNFHDGRIYAHGIPFNGTSGICVNRSLPVRAIILPSFGTENVLKKLSPAEAVMMLLGKFSYDVWDENAFDLLSVLLENIVSCVPVYSYACLKDDSAVRYLAQELDVRL